MQKNNLLSYIRQNYLKIPCKILTNYCKWNIMNILSGIYQYQVIYDVLNEISAGGIELIKFTIGVLLLINYLELCGMRR